MQHINFRVVVATLALALLCACGASTPTAAQSSPSAAQPSPSAAALSCTSSGPASASWQAAPQITDTPILSAVASGDTFTLTFRTGTPAFTVQEVATAHFVKDPSNFAVDLAGNAGVRIAMTGFRGDMSNYTGSKSLDSSGPLLLQVAELGDFEGYVSWGAGLSKPGCANVVASGSTLTFHFIPAP